MATEEKGKRRRGNELPWNELAKAGGGGVRK